MQFYQSLLNLQETPDDIRQGALKVLEGEQSFESLFSPLKSSILTENVDLICIGIQGSANLLMTFPVDVDNINVILDIIISKNDKQSKISSVIVKSLGKIVLESENLNSNSLLKAIKAIYSIFLTSNSSQVQVLAQSTIYRMVHKVFSTASAKMEGDAGIESGVSSSLESLIESEGDSRQESFQDSKEDSVGESKNDVIRNAYLVFRALCKLSMKPVQDGTLDSKSQALRSKYLALHLIQSLLMEKNHVFYLPAGVI